MTMELYAAMCDHPKIQENWSPGLGDRVLYREAPTEAVTEEVRKVLWPDCAAALEILTLTKQVFEESWKAKTADGKDRLIKNADIVKSNFVWLPSLHSLLNLIDDDNKTAWRRLESFIVPGGDWRIIALRAYMFHTGSLVWHNGGWHYAQ